jgi:hypothetical protein
VGVVTAAVELTQGYVALIDDADLPLVMAAGSWCVSRCSATNVYARTSLGGQMVSLHTYLTGWPRVDHINGDGLDNRRANLRPVSARQNAQNVRTQASSTSGFKGVNHYKRTGRWRAHITVGGVHRHLGYFDTPEEAALAYDRAALEHFGEYARLNFPERNDQP